MAVEVVSALVMEELKKQHAREMADLQAELDEKMQKLQAAEAREAELEAQLAEKAPEVPGTLPGCRTFKKVTEWDFGGSSLKGMGPLRRPNSCRSSRIGGY